MRELTKSMLSYSMSAPVLLLQQLASTFVPSGSEESGDSTTTDRDGGIGITKDQVNEMLQALLQAGDTVQRDLVDAGFRLLGPESWTPSGLVRTAAEITSRIADGLRFVDPNQDGFAAWQEIGNKIEIYRLVKDIKSKLQIPSGRFPLSDYVDRCYNLGAFQALWAVEGLGHDYSRGFLPFDEDTTGILTDPKLKNIPAKSMLMLHAGIGLGFAEELLKEVSQSTDSVEVKRVLELFVLLCRNNSRPGYEGAAYESLGLVTRTWHRELMTVVDEQLLDVDETAAEYFWRGAGRALYFLPVNFVPGYGSITNAIRMSKLESPHEMARRNTLAGLAWASTVVNMLQPEVMESFMSRHGNELLGQDAFANGVTSSIIMRLDTTPGETFIKEFINNHTDPSLSDVWDIHIRVPGRNAIEKYHPVLRDNHRLGEIFRYQSLADLVASLPSAKS